MDVVWEDPPSSASRRDGGLGGGRWQNLALALKEHPGKWALASEEMKSGSATYVRAQLKKYGCEAVTRNNGDGTVRVYARWPEDVS